MRITIGRMPGSVTEIDLPDACTVAQALSLAGLATDGFEVRHNGSLVSDMGSTILAGDSVLLARKVKGNSIRVTVGRMPGSVSEYDLPDGATVSSALVAAGLATDGFEVRHNGSLVSDMGSTVLAGDSVLLARKVKGNELV